MPLSNDPDGALTQIRDAALALPEVEERASHGQPTFFVAGRMFAQFRHNHHGDGRTVLAVRTGEDEEATMLVEAAPELYSTVAYLRRGWVGLAVGRPDTDWAHVADWIARSWAGSAPARLLEAGAR
ncbi:MAG: MmcQ/YjbR family DNA-binding protein [Pseudomonadota bacterium]